MHYLCGIFTRTQYRSPSRHSLLPLATLIMRQCRSRPWRRCTFNRIHIQNHPECSFINFWVILNKLWISLEIRVLEYLPIFCISWSKMNGKMLSNPVVTLQLLLQRLENLSTCPWWFVTLHVLKLCPLCSPPTPVFPCASGDRRFIPVSWSLYLECFPVAYSIGSWLWLVRTGFPELEWPPRSSSTFSGLTGSLRSLVLSLVNLHWKSFLALSDMALCFLIGSDRKIVEMAAREHREIHNVEQTKKVVPFVTCETLFASACQRVGFWCQQIRLRSSVSKLILSNNQQIKRKLDIFQLWSFWSQLRCLQRCTPQDSPWEECVCLWVRSPRLTIDQHPDC